MKLILIGIVTGLILAAVMFMAGIWTQSVRDTDSKNVILQTEIANDISDIKGKLEKMDTKLDIIVKIATSPTAAELDRAH